MQEIFQTWHAIVSSTIQVCKYVHDCASLSLCKEKYVSWSTSMASCLLCQLEGGCVSSFTKVQCIV